MISIYVFYYFKIINQFFYFIKCCYNTMLNNNMELLDNISRETLFCYVWIFVIIMFIFSKMKIGLNIIFGSMIALLLLSYSYKNRTRETQLRDELYDREKNSIKPKLSTEGHDEIIDFLFSIQDFYVYNPLSYSGCIKSIDEFFMLYDETFDDNSLAGENFEMMKTYKMNAITHLGEISFGLEPNVEYDKKLQMAIKNLEEILNHHLMHIYKIHQQYIYKNGITTNTKFINKNELQPANAFNDVLYGGVIE